MGKPSKPIEMLSNRKGTLILEEWDFEGGERTSRVELCRCNTHETAKWVAECVRNWYETVGAEDPPDRIVVI